MKFETVCVCGAGTMGSGIAQVCAMSGFPTLLFDVNAAMLERAEAGIGKNLQALVAKGRMSKTDSDRAGERLRFTTDLHECVSDIVIEAIIEREEEKVKLFNELLRIHPDTILASNTSSLSVTAIAEKLSAGDRLAGLHFFNPAPVMKLLEIVCTLFTDPKILKRLVNFAQQLGKTPVLCKDSPGFIVNRVARPYYIESLRLLEEQRADMEMIDLLLEGIGFRMGPFKLMDLIGNDINYSVSCSVYEQLGKPDRLRPSIIQQEKVTLGLLGKKTGKGYYEY
jgi:3-hydroxybutyryl-CoA dehydrogenase